MKKNFDMEICTYFALKLCLILTIYRKCKLMQFSLANCRFKAYNQSVNLLKNGENYEQLKTTDF